jgi:hypothetical protein
LTTDGIAKIAALAAQCKAAFPPPAPNHPSLVTPFSVWAQESHELAKSAAYADLEPHDTPGAVYVTNAQRVARERVALAGYRLAAVLNEIFR